MRKNVVVLPRVKLYGFAKTGHQRSVKQQANSRAVAYRTMRVAMAIKAVQAMPTESWWIGLDRQALEERAHREVVRMSASKFSQSFGVDG